MSRSSLRRLAERPFTERERQRAFTLAALVLLLAAALLTLTAGDDGRHPTPRASTPSTTAPPTPSPESEPPRPPRAPARRVERAPKPVTVLARRFLSDYLGYLYGQRRAGGIEGASRSLRRRLAADHPRVPAAARRRRPRVVALEGTRVRGRAATWAVRARVADGEVADFPVEMLITRRGQRLAVVQIGGE